IMSQRTKRRTGRQEAGAANRIAVTIISLPERHPLRRIITATDPAIRNQSLERACAGLSAEQLLGQCDALDDLRRHSDSLYERVRALLFLYAIHRFHLPPQLPLTSRNT